jgi:CubicO group peptidase (beta-lactamase class C family)
MSLVDRRNFLAGAGASLTMALAPKAGARATPPEDETARSLLNDLVRQYGFTGVGVGVRSAVSDQTLCSGFASVPFQVPVNPDTLFHIGSNSKHVTATAVLRLVDAGKVGLQTPIGEVLKGLPTAWNSRSIESLLTHTSGLPEYTGDFAWDRDYDHAGFLGLFPDKSPVFEAGDSWSYCNTGYVLLGWVIEAITHRTYREVIQTDIFAPLHLPHARIDDATALIPNRAEPYDLTGQVPRHAIRMAAGTSGWPDGGILFSARDLAPWDRALAHGPLLSEPMRRRMQAQTLLRTGRTVPYGFGLFSDSLRGRPFTWHPGGVPGFISIYLRCPDDRLSLMLMTNSSFGFSARQRVAAQTLAEHLAPGSTVRSLQPLKDAHPDLTHLARDLLDRGKAAPDAGMFAPEIRVLLKREIEHSDLPLPAWESKPAKFEVVEEIAGAAQLFRRYRTTYPHRTDHTLVGYALDGRIFWAFNC